MLSRFAHGAALAAAILLTQLPGAASAQNFDRPVRIIVPFAPGGTSDILARLISPKLSAAIGQSVVIENKPGASGNLGADTVAKATPDGTTLLLTDLGSLTTAPSLFSNLTYSLEKDLAPVTMVMFGPYVLAVHETVPARTAAELIAYAKANPGKLAVANSGVGGANHITAVVMQKELGIQFKHVPYKGGAAATRAVVSGESGALINGASATLPFVTNKQLIGLAVTGENRVPSSPDIPTFKEAKLPGGEFGTWQGIVVASGTPPAVIARLNAEIGKILETPELKAKIAEQGGEVRAGSTAAMATWLKDSTKRWGDVIREAGIKGE
ncbi:MAG: twin-arginine translocation pathway signal protein [Bradyrhizobium sp.]|jgi:tripartite-type tricarboxylate transporter receptor subunit TctC|nr:twin-arginine translocation pathway signal protein [Bradyrhizobium sp.]